MPKTKLSKQTILDTMELCPGSVLVGGSVRNLALGLPLSSDVDLLVASSKLSVQQYCEANALQVVKIVPSKSQLQGSGTAKCLHNGLAFDVSVTSQQIRANMLSRDFTVNAMWLSADRLASSPSRPADVVLGMLDANARLIRTPENEDLPTLMYDVRRVCRAYRLQVQLSEATGKQWSLSKSLLACLNDCAYEISCAFMQLGSTEQGKSSLRNEMKWMLSASDAATTFAMLSSMPSHVSKAMLMYAGGKLALRG